MHVIDPVTLYTVPAILALLSYILYLRRRSSRLPYPPGPKSLPILGNLSDLPRKDEAFIYFQWAKKYGNIFHVSMLGRHMVFLNTKQATNDLFEKRSDNYSDRNHLHMINDLMGWNWSFGMMAFGDRWKKHRKMFDRQFRASRAPMFWPIQRQQAYGLLLDLLESPDQLIEHLRHNAASTIMKITYGIDISKVDDRYVIVAEEALSAMAKAASPGAFLVDLLPILKRIPAWMPGAAFQRKARQWKQTTYEMRDAPFEAIKIAMSQGTASPCFVSQSMNDTEGTSGHDNDDVETIKNCAGLAYAAGAESIVSAMSSFFLAMILYPDVQKKAQKEITSVCHGRLPDFHDRPLMPYVDAICREVLRWSPVAPLGLPHMVTHDDVYNGYFIPAGSTIVGNTWAILHDEATYPDPSRFSPERFLPQQGKDSVSPDPSIAAFGYGRRLCPGRFAADAQLWITIASVLSVFNISPGIDIDGQPTPTEAKFTGGMISHPLPYQCTVTPRSQKTIALIHRSVAEHAS